MMTALATDTTFVGDLDEPPDHDPSGLQPVLAAEEERALRGDLDPADRLTCTVHTTWIHKCAHSATHCIPLYGLRFCLPCRQRMDIAVDELTGHVTLRCPRCERGAATPADLRLVAACQRSLALARPSGPGRAHILEPTR